MKIINEEINKIMEKRPKKLEEKKDTRKYKNGDGVEGIIVGEEYDKIDKNKDGRILISEMYPLSEQEVIENILKEDPNFSKTHFKSYVRSLFTLFQKAWSNNDYKSLRAIETDSIYYEHKSQLEEMINNNIYDKRENVKVKGCLIKDFHTEGDKEILVVALTAKMTRNLEDVHYIKDFQNDIDGYNSGNIPYIMKFMRKKGVKTKSNTSLATTNCSNCGAVIHVDNKGVCTYCKTSLVTGEVDWVLVDIKNIEIVKS